MGRVSWTPEEDARAMALRAEGKSYIKIGKAMGRGTSSVEGRLARLTGRDKALGLTCSKCAKPVTDKCRTGICRMCLLRVNNSDPAFNEKRLERLGVAMAALAGTDMARERSLRGARVKMQDPEYVAKITHILRTIAQPRSRLPEAVAKRDYKDIGAQTREQRLAHIPPKYRELYDKLKRSKLMRASEAAAVIQAQVRADRARMSPFERQMADLEAKVKNGTQDIGVLEGSTGTAFHLRSVGRRG